ncbi:MAG: hypothetical protein M0Z91_12195 [Actinomycetota bacterium]|nr:hypothetical protein [Actinomycetota bacterium]
MKRLNVEGYELRGDLYYDAKADMWLSVEDGLARVGYDPLGLEINGTLAALVLAEPGREVTRGQAAGSLEAEKFVGPVTAPVSGVVEAVNQEVVGNLARIYADPYAAWLLAIRMSDPSELEELVTGDALNESFARRLQAYRAQGVLAR